MAFHPVSAELACVCGVAQGGGSELGGGDEGCASGGEGCVSGGGGEGRGGEGVDGGASGGGAVDFGEGGEGVSAEILPGVGCILGGNGGRTAIVGGDDCTAVCDPQLAPSAQKHVSKQMPLPEGELAVSSGGWRMPQSAQSAQSVPYWPSGHSAPGPPSSQQQPSEASAGIPMRVTVLMQRAGGAAGAGGTDSHIGNSEPGLSQ